MTAPALSFCATNLETRDTLAGSLESIDVIGKGTGATFEVVVADGPSGPETRSILEDWSSAGQGRLLVRHDRRNRGYGRRKAFEASTGECIVPFDTSIVYGPWLAELIRRYVALSTDRLLFSELCALRRFTIMAVGGWRDLIGGEDVDLYAPVVERFGLIAYPTGDPGSQARVMSSFTRQMRYAQGSTVRKLYRMFCTQRDQIIGANYRVADLMAFNRSKRLALRAGARVWFTAASVAANLSRIPRRRVDGANNYLYLRERVITSMLAADFRELGWDGGPPPRLPLTPDEVGYLDAASALWREATKGYRDLFPLKTDAPRQ